jgi:outer membrane protein TolC
MPASAQVMSMERAIETALTKYPSVAAQRAALAGLRANTQVIKDSRLPNVKLHDQVNVGTANGLSGSYFSLGLIVPTSGGRREQNSGSLASGNVALASADWEFFNFGRYQSEDQLAKADIDVGEAGVEREEFMLTQAVVSTYLELFWLRQILKIEGQNLARVDTVSRIINNLVRNGIRPGLDSSLASVELSRAKLNYYEIDEGFRRAFLRLGMLTGTSTSQIEIDTTFRVEALLGQPELIKVTLNHPLLRYQNNILARQTAELNVIRKAAFPRVSLLAAGWARGTSLDIDNHFGPLSSGFGYSRTNFLVGLAATVNLTDFRRSRSKTTAQEWKIREADSRLNVEELKLENALTTSDSVLATLRRALLELPTAIRSAESAYQQRLSLYNNGIENILGLTDALQILTKVEKQAVDIRRRAVEVRLQRAFSTSNYDDFFALFRRL